jgi:tripartite-type tricarboxylate transporter receptor subunit TctC
MRWLALQCLAIAGVLATLAAGGSGAYAEDFFKGKDISLYVGSGAGGAYDTYARLVARHYGRHIPGNPTIVVVDMRAPPAAR